MTRTELSSSQIKGVDLTVDVTGVLPLVNGGTGQTTLAAAGIVTSGGALGTPSSGTLTNATGLPIAGLTASTSTAVGVGTVELGHATDTTLSRSASGVLAVEGVVVPTVSSTSTLTNKRITKRVVAITLSATPAINTDNLDVAQILSMTVAITSLSTNLTGTPTSEQPLMVVFSSASALAIAHGASFQAGPGPLLTTTVAGKTHRAFYVWDAVLSKFLCMASDATGY